MKRSFGVVGVVLGLLSGGVQAADAVPSPISVDPPRATYEDVRAFMRGLVERHPLSARLITMGESDSGRAIEALAIGNGPVSNLVVASHHGNEYGSVDVARAVAASLAADPIPGQTIYVIPVLNIGGYDRKKRAEVAGGIPYDANRNYPGPCGSEGVLNLKSTASLARFIAEKNIVASATLHTYYPTVAYPWGLASEDLSTPYDDLFKALSDAAALESHYPTGNSTEMIYPANGTYEDYAYWNHGIWSLLFELGYSHSPDREDIEQMARVNVPGIRRMMEQAPRQRAEKHSFDGRCDDRLTRLDRHDE